MVPAHHGKHSGSPSPAALTYYIFEGILSGTVNGAGLTMSALTGGGGGSTKNRPDGSTNNPYMYGLKTTDTGKTHQHGGPIPLGHYKVGKPSHRPHLGLCAELDPQRQLPNNRGGFYIHNRGPHGSDGCIVPTDPAKFQQLMHALTLSNGATLMVLEMMDGSRFA